MSDDNVIDAEVVELADKANLPTVIEREDATNGAQTPIEGRDWSTYSRPERRCTASSSRTGLPCKNAAIKGSTVCRYHGGAAKQVKQAARTRLENAADLMAKQLLGIALTADSEQVKLTAIRDVLDRVGLKPPAEVVLSAGETRPAYETVFESIGGDADAAGFPSLSSEEDAAGQHASPASAYPDTGIGAQAEAGGDVAGCDRQAQADEYALQSSASGPPRQRTARIDDGDAQAGRRDGARSQHPPGPREVHITGMDAIRLANAANAASGVFDEQRAIESPHKRYLRR